MQATIRSIRLEQFSSSNEGTQQHLSCISCIANRDTGRTKSQNSARGSATSQVNHNVKLKGNNAIQSIIWKSSNTLQANGRKPHKAADYYITARLSSYLRTLSSNKLQSAEMSFYPKVVEDALDKAMFIPSDTIFNASRYITMCESIIRTLINKYCRA